MIVKVKKNICQKEAKAVAIPAQLNKTFHIV